MIEYLRLVLILHVIKIILAQDSTTTNKISESSTFFQNVTATSITINSTTSPPNLTQTMTSTLLATSLLSSRNSQNVTSSPTQTNINSTYPFLNITSPLTSSNISPSIVTSPVSSLNNISTVNVSMTSPGFTSQNFTSSTLTFNNTTYSNISTLSNFSPTFQSSSPSSIPVNTLTTTKSNSMISSSSPPQITGLSVDRITSPFWVQTRCDIDLTIDITNAQYQSDMEKRLSNAYANGSALVQPIGRRKRATTNGLYTLQLVNVQRITVGQKPTDLVYYIITTPNTFVQASTVVSNMNQLSLQQMSIFLGVPVTIVATYYDPFLQNPPIDQKLWIIGAVLGSLGGVVLIVWLVLFLYSRCIRPWDEPLINKFSSDIESSQNSNIHYKKEDLATYSENINPLVGLYHNENDQKNLNTREQKTQNSTISKKKKVLKSDKKLGRRYSSTSSTGLSSISSQDEKDTQPKIYKVQFEPAKLEKTPVDITDESQIKSKHKKNKKVKDKKKEKEISHLSTSESIEKVKMNQLHSIRESPKKTKNEGLTSVDDMNTTDMFHMKSDQLHDNGTIINLIEVKPTRTESNQPNDFQLLQPVPFLDSYNSIHIFPHYPKDNIVISDTSLNLIEIKETDLLEKDKNDMNRIRSIKNNLRTFDQLPSKSKNREKEMTADELIRSLKNEIKEVQLKNEKR